MDFQKVVEKRRTIRKFLNKDVSDEDIRTIIMNGSLAPSSKNRQPWKFVALRDLKKDTVAFRMIDWVQSFNKGNNPAAIFSNSVYKTAIAIQQAPVLILIYKKNLSGNEYPDLLSLGACLENMFLTAVNLKLGALWTTDIVYAEKAINAFLHVDQYELVSGFAVGYPKEIPPSVIKEKPIFKILK